MSNEELMDAFYLSLAKLDLKTFQAIQADDVVYNISGHSPISGCFRGKNRLMEDILPLVFGKINPEGFEFSKKWKCVCQSGDTAVCLMEADGLASNGVRYDQRYVHIFKFADGKIVGVSEFFDTALADKALFHDKPAPVRSDGPFDFDGGSLP